MRIICLCLILLSLASLANAQEYIYPNRLHSDQGLIGYRPYSPGEIRALESSPFFPNPPILTDWGQERRLSGQDRVYSVDLASSEDSLYCVYAIISSGQAWFVKSTDAGEEWSSEVDLGDTSVVDFNFFPDIASNGPDLVMGFRGQEQGRGENLFFRKSTDAGETWGPLRRVFSYWLNNYRGFASLSSSGRTLYFTYLTADPDSLRVVRSTDWGESWNGVGRNVAYLQSTPQPLRIASSGSFVHLVWVNETRPVSVRYSRSTDRGLTWSPEVDIAEDTLGAQRGYVSVDGSHVAISWMGYKYSPYMFTGDLFVRQSFDNGVTWDSARVLTDSHYVGQGFIHAKDSLLAASWEDFRFPENNVEAMARISGNLGESWGIEERISWGDGHSYSPVATGTGSLLHLLWGDVREAAPGLYYRANNLLTEIGENEERGNLPEETGILSAYPNPFNSSTTITISGAEEAEVCIYDITGRQVKVLQANNSRAVWDAGSISSGVYFARVAGERGDVLRLALLK